MRAFLGILLTGLLLIMPRQLAAKPPAAPEKPAVVQGGDRFAVDLYAQLQRERPGKNLFFSPASISLALTMTAAGAAGPTQAEMTKVLGLAGGIARATARDRKLLEQWNATDEKRPYQLRVANRLWGQQGYSIRPEFLALTRRQYGDEMSLLDFARGETARREINGWIEQQTEDKIKDLIPRWTLDSQTRLVLTNAIYFKGNWARQFDKKATRDENFMVSARRKVKTPLMHQKAAFDYAEDDTLQAIELPYAGHELSMVVLLPRKADALAELEKLLSLDRLRTILSMLRAREVVAIVPRFKLESAFDLKTTLESLGMKLAFSSTADFSGITSKAELCISAVVHKAFVDVDERGTEAAAATGIIMAKDAAARPELPPVVFRADHPFVFLIRDTKTGTILFLGRLTSPSK